jgi:hypothetical protein
MYSKECCLFLFPEERIEFGQALLEFAAGEFYLKIFLVRVFRMRIHNFLVYPNETHNYYHVCAMGMYLIF